MFESILELVRIYLIEPIKADPYWEITAFVGEVVFGGRFILQWLMSEFKKRSYMPIAFWYMSVVGSIILLAYFIHKKQPVMIATFSLQILIYLRNLRLIKRATSVASDNTDGR
jgi:lipid-A-disaccharide synthase-like uncharacterized protein